MFDQIDDQDTFELLPPKREKKKFTNNEHGAQLRLFSMRAEKDLPGQNLLFEDAE